MNRGPRADVAESVTEANWGRGWRERTVTARAAKVAPRGTREHKREWMRIWRAEHRLHTPRETRTEALAALRCELDDAGLEALRAALRALRER